MHYTRFLGGFIAAICLLCCAGCNWVGAGYLLIHGGPKNPRVYELDKKRTTVLVIEDPRGSIPRRTLRYEIAERAVADMLDQGLVENMISARSALDAVAAEDPSSRKTIAELGQALGADVVVWVGVESFSLSPDGQTFQPSSSVRMRVIDVTEDAVLYPSDDMKGYPLVVAPPPNTGDIPTTRSAMNQAERELAVLTGRAIAELFYEKERSRAARSGKSSE
ncbi:MAG: hypothetical protein H6815_01135 [Phycisphaeraceae bacterium]|nr:hypothetical protein [Phycisphaerales bacterium]MCB9859030.1 hypothetical protein [Phycisphaeraceae bacterium]